MSCWIGANGQLASDILRLWKDPAVTVLPATRREADVTDAGAVEALLQSQRPDAVVNTAAFHNMAACEDDPATALRENILGGWNVARAAAVVGARVYQISTDYVFDGEARTPYLEDAPRRAVNVYGAAKIATEDMVRQANPAAAIVRVSGLFGLAGSAGKGGNFIETMLRLGRAGGPVRAVSDQVTAPTNTADIAEALLPLVREGALGTFHLAAEGQCSWAQFAAAIFERSGLSPDFSPVTTAEFGAPVVRPMFSVVGRIPDASPAAVGGGFGALPSRKGAPRLRIRLLSPEIVEDPCLSAESPYRPLPRWP